MKYRTKPYPAMPTDESTMRAAVDWAICSRRSIRAFTDQSVDHAVISELLEVASSAPSGTNTQPWYSWVLTGDALSRVRADLHQAFVERNTDKMEYDYYPKEWSEPYLSRRRKVGFDLYGLLGLGRENKEGMYLQMARNFKFFDAPVGIIFAIDKKMATGSYLDFGCFLQSLMIAARSRGLDTCPQAAFADAFGDRLRRLLNIPESMVIACGLSLGYVDQDKIENTLITERAQISEFNTFLS